MKDVMRVPITCRADISIRDAAKIMLKHGIGSVIVVDAHYNIVGILTERDLMRFLAYKNDDPSLTHVREVMSKNVIVISENATLDDAASIMIKHNIKKLPVVDEDGKLVGIVTTTDLVLAGYKIDEEMRNLISPRPEEIFERSFDRL